MVPATLPKGIRRSFGKPAMSNHRGRTWDAWTVKLPGGSETKGYLDTTWGTRFHFEFEGRWYVGSVDAFKEERPSPHFDLTRKARDY